MISTLDIVPMSSMVIDEVVNVVFPVTVRFPSITVLPPTLRFFVTPTPPATVTDPVLVLVDSVASSTTNEPTFKLKKFDCSLPQLPI